MSLTLTPQETDQRVFDANLAALVKHSPLIASVVGSAHARRDVVFLATDEDAICAVAAGVPLCSKRRPLEEAQRFANRIDLEKSGGIIVMGFGAGHHVRAVVDRARSASTVIVFEPDVALLRAVLENIDCSTWLAQGLVSFVTDADDALQLSACIRGSEAFLSIGAEIVDHPPSRVRLGEAAKRFASRLTDAIGAMRTGVVTTLVQSDVTLRNQLMNIDHYVSQPDINDLRNLANNYPSVVVSAGPSLQRNLHLLSNPEIQNRAVIIAVQTMLKPLLDRGIRPHFVTALDHHEISQRFYEGLTAQDVEGVTLVIEPKANPAIPDSFPGAIRVAGDERLDELLGADVLGNTPKARIKPGATVAHLAYYLAKFLGSNPVILIGQDLGFTDGQYYADGASIHNIWAGELNKFRTLEMFEWERIVRNRRHLRHLKDHLGRPIYSDAQMETYLAHFETDFARDIDAGLHVIDATEGGVLKRGPEIMPLQNALDAFAQKALPKSFRNVCCNASSSDVDPSSEPARLRIKTLRREVRDVARLSRDTAQMLHKINTSDQKRTNELIARVHKNRDRVERLDGGYSLVRHLNQAGALKRFKADRPLMLAGDELDPRERQKRQIDRDAVNVTWVADAADVADTLLDDAESALRGGAKRTRDPSFDDSGIKRGNSTSAARKLKCPAVICFSSQNAGDIDVNGTPALVRTIQRLRRAKFIDRVLILAPNDEHAAQATGLSHELRADPRVEVVSQSLPSELRQADAHWAARIQRARRWARHCWRGGLGGASCFDETFTPQALHALMHERKAPAAIVVGANWCAVDPALCDDLILRHAECPERHPMTFTQAVPGLAPCVISATLTEQMATAARSGVTFASMGGLLGYLPAAPAPDPIARPACVTISPTVRDALQRFIADDLRNAHWLGQVFSTAGDDATAEQIASAARTIEMPARIDEIVIELVGRTFPASGLHAQWYPNVPNDQLMKMQTFERIVKNILVDEPDAAITLAGPGGTAIAGDPVDHPEFAAFVERARELGARWIHVRTSARSSAFETAPLYMAQCDVVSIDLLAVAPEVARAITGTLDFEHAVERTLALHQAMTQQGGSMQRWVVPRITRCDATYEDIEPFYDRWSTQFGAAAIDALPRTLPGERIAPLTVPLRASAHLASRCRHILPDGTPIANNTLPGVST